VDCLQQLRHAIWLLICAERLRCRWHRHPRVSPCRPQRWVLQL